MCSFKSFSIPYNQKKMYVELELEEGYCAYAKQSNQPSILLLSPSALSLLWLLTLKSVKLLFFHGSGGMSLVRYVQAFFFVLAALTSDCQPPN